MSIDTLPSEEVVIIGIGQVPVGEHWDLSLHTLATRAIQAARRDAGGITPQAVYVGNLLSSVVSRQSNLGSLIATHAALNGAEAYTVEASEASGAAALRMAYLSVASGFTDIALAVGVEKVTDCVGDAFNEALSRTTDYDYEAMQGVTPAAHAALLMTRYLHEHDLPADALADFAVLAHANAAGNPNAFMRRAIDRSAYERSSFTSAPLRLFDMAPYADGAAALILTRSSLVPEGISHPLVRITASNVVCDTHALHDRPNPLAFDAAAFSIERALRKSGILPADLDLFELCDSFSIYAALTLEATGIAPRGEGWRMAGDGSLSLSGSLPISTLGGMKARGNPLGASGAYQAVEAALQLRGEAGINQIPNVDMVFSN